MAAPQSETLVGGVRRRFSRLVSGDDRSVRVLIDELRGLVVTYVKQETVDPLKKLVRYVAWGVAGSFLLATGAVLVTLAVVRLLQAETGAHLTGDLTWVPYVGGLLFALAVLVLAASRIGRKH